MDELNPQQIIREHFAALGRLGGAARAAKLSPERRKAIATKASKAAKRSAAASKKKDANTP